MHQQDIFLISNRSLYIPCGLLKKSIDYCKSSPANMDSGGLHKESRWSLQGVHRSPQDFVESTWTPSGVHIQLTMSSTDTLQGSIFNSGELIDPSGVQYSTTVSSSNTPRVQYSTTVSSSNTLQSSIFNYHELNGHTLEFNIQLQWAHWTSSGV